MLINRKAIRGYAKEKGKRTSKDFIISLDKKVTEIIDNAIYNARNFRTLKEGDLRNGKT